MQVVNACCVEFYQINAEKQGYFLFDVQDLTVKKLLSIFVSDDRALTP